MFRTPFEFFMRHDPVTEAILKKLPTADILRLNNHYSKKSVDIEERQLLLIELFSRVSNPADISYQMAFLRENSENNLALFRQSLQLNKFQRVLREAITSPLSTLLHQEAILDAWRGETMIATGVNVLLEQLKTHLKSYLSVPSISWHTQSFKDRAGNNLCAVLKELSLCGSNLSDAESHRQLIL